MGLSKPSGISYFLESVIFCDLYTSMKANPLVRLLYGMKEQVLSIFAFVLFFMVVVVPAQAELDVLVIGSTHSFSDRNESGVVQEKAFNPTTIGTHLQSILAQDSAISETVNVAQGSPSNGMVTATVTVTGSATERLFVKVQATEN